MSQLTRTHILLVEDSDDDAILIHQELARAGIVYEGRRVETEEALRDALRDFAPDVVLTDHSLAEFGGHDALRLVREAEPQTPVLIVTGSLDEETAAEYIKSGATDYIVKHRIFRLGDAVMRALALRRAREAAIAAERARTQSEQRFQKLVKHASDAITLLDVTGRITNSTGAVTPTLGYDIGELAGRSVFEIVHPDDRAGAQALLAEALLSEGAVVRSTLRGQHKDGSWRYLDIVCTNYLRDSAVEALVINYHDVTPRIRAEAAARALEEERLQTQKMEAIGRLASKAAHDFNNVLAVIKLCCDFALLAVDEDDTTVRPELIKISRATDRGSQFTRQLVAVTRQEPVPRQRVDINAAIQRMIGTLRNVLGEHVVVSFVPAASHAEVWVDPPELERVVVTLAASARETMPGGGTLTFQTRDVEVGDSLAEAHAVEPGPYVHLAIRDTSTGMDAETRSRVFEPIFTVQAGGTGAGVGLTAVYRAVERWGGFVRVDSEVGKGSTFHVFLPWQP